MIPQITALVARLDRDPLGDGTYPQSRDTLDSLSAAWSYCHPVALALSRRADRYAIAYGDTVDCDYCALADFEAMLRQTTTVSAPVQSTLL